MKQDLRARRSFKLEQVLSVKGNKGQEQEAKPHKQEGARGRWLILKAQAAVWRRF